MKDEFEKALVKARHDEGFMGSKTAFSEGANWARDWVIKNEKPVTHFWIEERHRFKEVIKQQREALKIAQKQVGFIVKSGRVDAAAIELAMVVINLNKARETTAEVLGEDDE